MTRPVLRCRSFVLPISRLANQFRCIAYDLPTGKGDGARLATHSHRDLTLDLLALLDHLRLPRVNVNGYSFGSTIALRALHDAPERFARAVLRPAGAPSGRRRWSSARSASSLR